MAELNTHKDTQFQFVVGINIFLTPDEAKVGDMVKAHEFNKFYSVQ